MSKSEFAAIVEQAIGQLPAKFGDAIDEVPIEVKDRPTRKQLESVSLDDDHLLLGLYIGVPLTQRSVQDSGRLPDVIYLFQEDIEQSADNREGLVQQIRITLLHEIGHYYGLDEDQLDELGYG